MLVKSALILIAMVVVATLTSTAAEALASGNVCEAGYDVETLSYVACAAADPTTESLPPPTQTVCTDVLASYEPPPASYPADKVWVPLNGYYDRTCTNPDGTSTTTRITKSEVLQGFWVTPPLTPEQLAQSVIASLPIPRPQAQFAPQPDLLAVNLPIWLWIDNPAPVSETQTAGGLSVTVTANLSTTTWNMGEPIDPNNPQTLKSPIECDGPGTKLELGDNVLNPPCGYTYTWQSLPERTAGTGKWPVQITATWAITWSASTGASGTDTATTTTETALQVAAYNSVLVPDTPR